MDGDATFGALLRRHRRRAKLSQEELAARAYVSTRAISDLERGVNARPRLHTAVALADGLGLAGEERIAFEQHARQHDPAPRAASVRAHARAPVAVDSFVDDGAGLADLLGLLGDRSNRLVTLIGPGGIGKTRLAMEVAHRIDGPVAFVALASLSDPALLAATVGDALGVEHGPSRTHLESLIDHLASRPLTLVLDNVEQIVAAAPDVAALLRACPDLQIVATSRVPLRIAGERRYAVRPLGGDDADLRQRPGVRLFLERAAASGFTDHGAADELAAIAELCSRLDGLPLAIELAAARSGIVAPDEMLAKLDQVLDLLGTGRSDAPAQHHSIRAALEWSFRLLPAGAQEAFLALGVFAAGASPDAAMAVWDLPVSAEPTYFDLVQTLAEAHLITVARDRAGSGRRLVTFETTRQFARQRLQEVGALDQVMARLTDWAVDLVDRAEPELFGPDQAAWLDRLDEELPNLRNVRTWLTEQGTDAATETGLHLVSGLQRFWDIRSRWTEGVAWLTAALAPPGGSPATRAKALKALGVMNRCLGNLDAAEAELERAVALYEAAGDVAGMASCLNNRGVIALDRADFPRADDVFRRALEMCEALGDDRLTGIVLNNLSLSTIELGGLRDAMRWCRRSRELLLAQGNVFTLSWVDDNLASVLTRAGHPRWAVQIHEQAIRRRLDLADESGLVWSLEALAEAWTRSARRPGPGTRSGSSPRIAGGSARCRCRSSPPRPRGDPTR